MTKNHLLEKVCEECKISYHTKKETQRFCSVSCQSKFSSRLRKPELSIHFSNLAIQRHANGDESFGWKSRFKLEPSYPEKYFMKVFENEGIEYHREVKVGRFFIDFVLPGKIAVEIDGRRHEDQEVAVKDARKDMILRENGYTVVRIKWYNPVSELAKSRLYEQINALLVTVVNTHAW